MAGWLSTRVTWSWAAALGPEHGDPIGPGRVAGVGQAAGGERGADGVEQPGRRRLDRELELGLALGVVDGHGPHELALEVHVA